MGLAGRNKVSTTGSRPETRHTHTEFVILHGAEGAAMQAASVGQGKKDSWPQSLQPGNKSVRRQMQCLKGQSSSPREGPHLFPLLFNDLLRPLCGVHASANLGLAINHYVMVYSTIVP